MLDAEDIKVNKTHTQPSWMSQRQVTISHPLQMNCPNNHKNPIYFISSFQSLLSLLRFKAAFYSIPAPDKDILSIIYILENQPLSNTALVVFQSY